MQIKKIALALLLVSTFALISCGKNPTLVTVGSEKITENDLNTLARINPRLKPRLATPDGKQKILENYVEQELLYQESEKRGLARSADVKDKIKLYEKIIIAQALLDDELNKQVKEYYDNHKDEFERVKVSQILIRFASPDEKPVKGKPKERSEAEAMKMAEAAEAQLAKGEDFTKVALQYSDDDKTKSAGGDLGYITLRDKRLERLGWLPVAEKAFALKAGDVSDIIKTKEALHIIKVTEGEQLQPLAEAEPAIKFRMQSDLRNQLLESLKKKYKVEYAKGMQPPPPAPGMPMMPGQGQPGTPPPPPPPAESAPTAAP